MHAGPQPVGLRRRLGLPPWRQDGDQYFWYHNDHLGTPQQLTDTSGQVVWSAQYTAFGEAVIDTETVTNNLRFPGQYYDAETGLLYNNQRYYDSSIGRYLRTDPLGIVSGINGFSYADSNPLIKKDPLGLWVEANKIVPPEEAFTAIETAIKQRETLIDEVSSWQYRLIHGLGTIDAQNYGSFLEQEYLNSFLVAAQAVEPAWVGENKFVFTCKYGWIDAGHFWATALMTFSMRLTFAFDIPFNGRENFDVEGMAQLPYYVTTGLIEGMMQGSFLYVLDHWWVGRLMDLGLTPTAQSTGSPEDFESNWQGALFAAGILGLLASEHPDYAMGPDYSMVRQWDKFLYENQAITFSGKSDPNFKILENDAKSFWGLEEGEEVYIGPRWVGWDELKKQSIAYCLLCDGDKPRAGRDIRTYKSKFITDEAN